MSEVATAAVARARKTLSPDRKKKYDLLFTAMLLVSTVLIATCVYQSSRWGSITILEFQTSALLRGQASGQTNLGNRMLLIDVSLFLDWIEAVAQNDTARAQVLEDRFPDRLKVAFDVWVNTSTPGDPIPPGSPFDLPEYSPAPFAEAERLSEEADAHFENARRASQTGNNYVLTTILLATVLFLASVATRWAMGPAAATAFLAVCVGVFVTALVIFLSLPKSFGF